MSSRRAGGFTLVEMIVAIVIIGVGLSGVLVALTTAVKSSADPLVRKQMLAVAEEMIEEVALKPFVAPTGGFSQAKPATSASCGSAAAVRVNFDDVADYDGYQTNGICTIEGVAVAGLADYQIVVAAVPATLSGVAARKITVTVTHGAETISLDGWRTGYAS